MTATATSPPASPRHARASPSLGATATVVILASIMSVLDVTIVNVAFNQLATVFDASLATIAWAGIGYTLALATVIPVTGWAIGRFGTRRLYLTAIALFAAGSLLAGCAWDTGSLIAFRVVQGLGGGMLMPVGMTILMRAAGREAMGRTMALMGIPVLVGPLAGPVLGGWLIDEYSWRWIFWVNLPVGALALLLAYRTLDAGSERVARRLDVPGLAMLSPGLAALIYGLATGGDDADFTSPGVLVPVVGGVLLIAGFVIRARRTEHPLIDLGLLRHRSFAVPALTLAAFNASYFGSMMLGPLFWQLARGHTATEAGLLGIPQVLATGISMQLAGRLVDRVPPGRVVLAGVTTATVGFLLMATQIQADSPYWAIAVASVVMGIGVGATIMPAITASSRSLPPAQIPGASTAINIVQQVAASAGGAAISVLLTRELTEKLSAAASGTGERGLGAVRHLSPAALEAAASPLAGAFRGAYFWAVALMAVALVPALLLPRRRPAATTVDSVRS
ncbi:DHA2 family efflux MFS transporter permease subunit [Longispora albida]|uniref:DHA2 family efflux MFS transporter permease subunit n=1 Tax=Longispora albida TaxID=203523 RepID=UPI0003616AA8|nr:DHA2 family efflux MFS transporter permease subunit [Longispora albida]